MPNLKHYLIYGFVFLLVGAGTFVLAFVFAVATTPDDLDRDQYNFELGRQAGRNVVRVMLFLSAPFLFVFGLSYVLLLRWYRKRRVARRAPTRARTAPPPGL